MTGHALMLFETINDPSIQNVIEFRSEKFAAKIQNAFPKGTRMVRSDGVDAANAA